MNYPTEAPVVHIHERERLFTQHRPVYQEWVSNDLPLADVAVPYCGKCREVWGDGGCTTVRVLGALYFAEREGRRIADYAAGVVYESSQTVLRARSYLPQEDCVELRMRLSGQVLIAAGISLIDATLMDMRQEFVWWFKKETHDPMEDMARRLSTMVADRARAAGATGGVPMTLADVSDTQLEHDAEELDDRAGMATHVSDIAFFQRVAAVVRAYVAERKAAVAVLTARDALTEECAGLRRGQDLVAGKLLELVAERDRLRATAEGNA